MLLSAQRRCHLKSVSGAGGLMGAPVNTFVFVGRGATMPIDAARKGE